MLRLNQGQTDATKSRLAKYGDGSELRFRGPMPPPSPSVSLGSGIQKRDSTHVYIGVVVDVTLGVHVVRGKEQLFDLCTHECVNLAFLFSANAPIPAEGLRKSTVRLKHRTKRTFFLVSRRK